MRLTLLLAILIAFTASAQKFSPGYYITNSGDTIKGNLALKNKGVSIDKIVTAEGLFLAPKDISGFGLDEINYVVRKVSMDKTPIDGFVIDTVFLEVMNRGKILLFYMLDENDKAHFYIENENGPQELTVRLNDKDQGVSVTKLETYKSVLKGIFPTCTDLFPAIDKTVFGRKSIESIYTKLYNCRFLEAPPVMKKEENKNLTEIGIYGGVSIAQQSFSHKYDEGRDASVFVDYLRFPKKSISPTGGVYLETRFTRKRMLALRHEVSYLQYEQASNTYLYDKYQLYAYQGTVGAKYLMYSAILRLYFFPQSKVRPFFDVGISPCVLLSKNSTLNRIANVNYTISYTVQAFINKTHSTTVSSFVGIGVAYDRLSLEFRYEPMRIFTEEVYGKVKTKSFTLGYRVIKLRKENKS